MLSRVAILNLKVLFTRYCCVLIATSTVLPFIVDIVASVQVVRLCIVSGRTKRETNLGGKTYVSMLVLAFDDANPRNPDLITGILLPEVNNLTATSTSFQDGLPFYAGVLG